MDSSIMPTGLFRELARPLAVPERPRPPALQGTAPVDAASPAHWEARRQALLPYGVARRFRPTERALRKLEARRRRLQDAMKLVDGAAESFEHQRGHFEVEKAALGEPREGSGT